MADDKSSAGLNNFDEVKLTGENAEKHKETINNQRGLSFTITADVSNALKGLKAVQRETRKSIAAIKELDELNVNSLTDKIVSNINDIRCPSCDQYWFEWDEEFVKEEDSLKLIRKVKKCNACGWQPKAW